MILAIGSCTSDAKLIATCTELFSGSQSKSPRKMFDEGCETLKANALRHHGAHLGFLVFAMMSVFTTLSSNTRQAKASVETLVERFPQSMFGKPSQPMISMYTLPIVHEPASTQ
jgi:hypothetical protein